MTPEDISERKRLVAQIEQGKKEWEAVVDAVPELILLADERGRVLRCNRAALKRLAGSGEERWQEVIDRPVASLLFGDHGNGHGLVNTPEAQFPCLDGWFEVSVYPVESTSGPRRTVYLLKDITGRKKMEAALLAAQKMASLGTLVAGIAHEINSPLQVITGVSESLLASNEHAPIPPDRLKRSLEMVYRNGWRVAEIVRALRTYAHTSDHLFSPCDLNAIVQDTLLLIEHQLESWSNIAIAVELAPELPELECDREQIAQALINLLTNARDALPAGGEIRICTGWDPGRERVSLEVGDNGEGIPSELRDRIFDPFFTTKPLGQGTGLGLAIVQGVIRAHGGEIHVVSRPKAGTVFTLEFPARQPRPAGTVPAPAQAPEGRVVEPAPASQPKLGYPRLGGANGA